MDTYRSRVAAQALELGASIINDVWGLKADPDMASVVKDYESSIVLMHNQPTTDYIDLLPDVMDSLAGSIQTALNSGIPADRIIVDPGIGFGKTAEHNIAILQRLNEFKELGYPLLVGVSRKSTIGLILGLPVDERMEGTAATVALSISRGADIVRVHDVKEMLSLIHI